MKRGAPNSSGNSYEENVKKDFRSLFYLFIFLLLYEVFVISVIVHSKGELFLFYSDLYIYGSLILFAVLLYVTSIRLRRELKNLTPSKQSNDRNNSASGDVFYRIYEVVAGLSIYVASQGIIFSGTPASLVILSPIKVASSDPVRFLVYLIFIVTSIQFIIGISQHFEFKQSLASKHGTYSLLNYILIIWQAISMLGMAEAISSNQLVYFAAWYILLLVIDTFWIFFYRIFRFQTYGFHLGLNKKVMALTGTFSQTDRIENTVHRYWLLGNFAYIFLLSILEPLIYLKIALPPGFMMNYFIVLTSVTIGTTIMNGECLSSLDLAK